MAEQPSLLGRPEARAAAELSRAPHVVEQRCGEEQVGAQAGVELRRLAAERRHADSVLQEPARIAVMAVRTCRRQRSKRIAKAAVPDERAHDRREPRVGDLRSDELEEPVQLVGVTTERWGQLGEIHVGDRLYRANLHLQLPSEALDPSEDLDRVSLVEAPVGELDVAPHACLDSAARVRELGDRRHDHESMSTEPLVRSAAMADVMPFRAVRYSGAAGPLADLVAPPYDSVDEGERAQLYTRSPYNVVHVTLPESAEDAGRLYRGWLADGILEQDDEAAGWIVAESYVGPDGVARERHGIVASLAAEPYDAGHVLPHERTHARIREERRRLLRATRVQPEPIFVLADVSLELEAPAAPPDLEVDGTRLWRTPGFTGEALRDAQLLIADGHHRYESAVELGEELDAALRIMALVVPAHDAGLHAFPTHRVFAGRLDLRDLREGERYGSLEEALTALRAEPFARSAAVAYRGGSVELVRGEESELDVELVDRHGLAGISYTARAAEAAAAVDRGEADVAFLLREPRVDDVFAVARHGERMPPKSTYFFPKPLSGLLFHPVEP